MQPAESDMFGNLFDDDAEPVSEPQKTEKENKSTQPPNPETIELTVDSGREVDPLPDDLKIDDEFLSFGDDGKSEPAQPESTNPDSLDPLDRVEKQMDGAGRLTPESIPESIPDALEEILSLDNEPHPLNDDLLAGLDVPSGPAGPLDPPAPDPFQANDDEPIRIDGVDGAYGSEVISILCPVCESRVYGKRREKSYQIKCEDCFSMVDIPSSEEWDEKNQGSGDQRKQAGSDMQFSVDEPELKLEAPVVKPTIDYNTDDDMGLEPIDNDLLAPEVHPIETELFHRQDPHPGTPDSSQSSASETTQPVTDSTEEDLLLQPVDEDLGPLISTHTELDQPQLAELVPDDDQLELISDEHAVGPTSHTSTPDGQATQLEAENDDDQLEAASPGGPRGACQRSDSGTGSCGTGISTCRADDSACVITEATIDTGSRPGSHHWFSTIINGETCFRPRPRWRGRKRQRRQTDTTDRRHAAGLAQGAVAAFQDAGSAGTNRVLFSVAGGRTGVGRNRRFLPSGR